ncbi:hypothetical protein [Vibrio metschnikovii]|nr:hypothetical protein [Vibrio metschnikovii]
MVLFDLCLTTTHAIVIDFSSQNTAERLLMATVEKLPILIHS